MLTQLAELGKKRVEDYANVQTDLLDKIKEMSRQWLTRAQEETRIASEFAAKLTEARTIPEAMAVCQECTTRRFEMMAEDGKHLLADSQKFMQVGARLLSSAPPISGTGGPSA